MRLADDGAGGDALGREGDDHGAEARERSGGDGGVERGAEVFRAVEPAAWAVLEDGERDEHLHDGCFSAPRSAAGERPLRLEGRARASGPLFPAASAGAGRAILQHFCLDCPAASRRSLD